MCNRREAVWLRLRNGPIGDVMHGKAGGRRGNLLASTMSPENCSKRLRTTDSRNNFSCRCKCLILLSGKNLGATDEACFSANSMCIMAEMTLHEFQFGNNDLLGRTLVSGVYRAEVNRVVTYPSELDGISLRSRWDQDAIRDGISLGIGVGSPGIKPGTRVLSPLERGMIKKRGVSGVDRISISLLV
jgi:hypothetical protein